jgi:hypothetical protein
MLVSSLPKQWILEDTFLKPRAANHNRIEQIIGVDIKWPLHHNQHSSIVHSLS